MKWKLIFNLSLYGLALAFVIDHIAPDISFPILLVIAILCSYVVAKKAHREYFLHGFLIGLSGCVWITLLNLIFSKHYDPNPYWFIIVIVYAIVFGLFSFIASRITKHRIA